MIYRDATPQDALSIAHLHAESWRSAYRGAFSHDFLESRVHDERKETWLARFNGAESHQFFVLLAEDTTRLAGFACVFPDRDPVFGSFLDNLHVTPRRTGQAIGRRLMSEVARRLQIEGRRRGLYLWVVEQNHRARAFYEKAGGVVVGSEIHTMPDGQSVVALRCHWPDLKTLLP